MRTADKNMTTSPVRGATSLSKRLFVALNVVLAVSMVIPSHLARANGVQSAPVRVAVASSPLLTADNTTGVRDEASAIPTDSATSAVSTALSAPAPRTTDGTGRFQGGVTFSGDGDRIEGGTLITFYNGISISGNSTLLPAGAYSVVSYPKDIFEFPKIELFGTTAKVDHIDVRETQTAWQVITTYTDLYGGDSIAVPQRVTPAYASLINGETYTLAHEFYTADGALLSSSETTVYGVASIGRLSPNDYRDPKNLYGQTDTNHKVNPGVTELFEAYHSAGTTQDKRDVRISVTPPADMTLALGSDWTFDAATHTYSKDVPREQLEHNLSFPLTMEGVDLSRATEWSPLTLSVDVSIAPIRNGVVETDLPASTCTISRPFYLSQPKTDDNVGDDFGIVARTSLQMVTKDVQDQIDGKHLPFNEYAIPMDKAQLDAWRIRKTHQVLEVNSEDLYREPLSRKMYFDSSRSNLGKDYRLTHVRLLIVQDDPAKAARIKEILAGAKLYVGRNYWDDGDLIADSVVPWVSATMEDSYATAGWYALPEDSNYGVVRISYPADQPFNGNDEIAELTKCIYVDMLGVPTDAFYDQHMQDVQERGFSERKTFADVSLQFHTTTTYESGAWHTKWRRALEDDVLTSRINAQAISLDSVLSLNERTIVTGQTISATASIAHSGNPFMGELEAPQNPYVYWLVSDGLEPSPLEQQEQKMWESVEVIRGYKPGYNLVAAKPYTIDVPSGDNAIAYTHFAMSFQANERLREGTYAIEACLVIDNNDPHFVNGRYHKGIVQKDNPQGDYERLMSGLLTTVTTDAYNRAHNPNSFTYLRGARFTIYPSRASYALKDVKLSGEPDSAYASSVGNRATLGSALTYRSTVTNDSMVPIDQLSFIDVLPYPGDHAIVPNDKGVYLPRGSEFRTPLTNVDASEMFDIFYSTDEVKQSAEENYVATWHDVSAGIADPSRVTMLKAVMKPGKSLDPGQSAFITYGAVVEDAEGLIDGSKAYGSFAYTLNDGHSFAEAFKSEVRTTFATEDVKITKVDAEDPTKRLAGATFALYTEDGRLIRDNIKTNANGEATLIDCVPGRRYYVEETAAPTGYEISENPRTSIDMTTAVREITIANEHETLKREVRKYWDDAQNADGLRPSPEAFAKSIGAIYYDETAHAWTPYTGKMEVTASEVPADGSGHDAVYLLNVKVPVYLNGKRVRWGIKETKVPEGYVATYANNDATLLDRDDPYIINTHIAAGPNDIMVIKVDAADETKRLEGAAFSLYTEDGSLVEYGVSTNKLGEVIFRNLDPSKKYRVQEAWAPNGYASTDDIWVDMAAGERKIVVPNEKLTATVAVRKYWQDSEDFDGIRPTVEAFKDHIRLLYSTDGTEWLPYTGYAEVDTADLSDSYDLFRDQYRITFKKLPLELEGKELRFAVEEVTVPAGYTVQHNDGDKSVAYRTTRSTFEVSLSNKHTADNVPSYYVKLIKVDAADENKRLAGATFSLYTEDGTLLREGITTNARGEAWLTECVSGGKYYLEETAAPEGYVLPEDPKTSFEPDDWDTEVIVKNQHTAAPVPDPDPEPTPPAPFPDPEPEPEPEPTPAPLPEPDPTPLPVPAPDPDPTPVPDPDPDPAPTPDPVIPEPPVVVEEPTRPEEPVDPAPAAPARPKPRVLAATGDTSSLLPGVTGILAVCLGGLAALLKGRKRR